MNDQVRLGRAALSGGVLLAVVGAALSAMGFMQVGSEKFAGSYLFGWMFWASMALGCLSLTILFNAVRGRWATPMARIWEAGGGPTAVALIFVLMIPLLVPPFRDALYGRWIHHDPNDHVIVSKESYLNLPFWYFRTVVFMGIFAGLGYFFKTWTRNEELTGEEQFHQKRNNLAGVGIVIFILVMTFFTTDVVMSVDPHWSSTMFAFIWVINGALAAMAFAVLLVVLGSKAETYKKILQDKLMTKDFGNMLLMLVMLWAYFTFSQFLIIWSGNLPEFSSFYHDRLTHGWNIFGVCQIFGNFFVPFLLLLSPGVKRDPIRLGIVAAWILFFRFTDVHYIVMPFVREHFAVTASDIGCFLLIGGVWLAHFGYQVGRSPLLTTAHPYMNKEAIADAS